MSREQIDLAAIRARVEAATPGPYTVGEELVDPNDPAWNVFEPNGSAVAAFCTLRHATLFACAPTDLAALCDEVDRLRSKLVERNVAAGLAVGLAEASADLREHLAAARGFSVVCNCDGARRGCTLGTDDKSCDCLCHERVTP